MMWQPFLLLALLINFSNGALNPKSIQDEEEKDLFELWMKEMEKEFDKDFEEFVKNMEEASKESRRGTIQKEHISGKSRMSQSRMSQNTTDKFQELVASMRKDMTDEFWKFMRSLQDEMQKAFEGFMSTVEQEMDAYFDDFMGFIMGEDTRKLSKTYEEEFEEWKIGQLQVAYDKYLEYSKSKRNAR